MKRALIFDLDGTLVDSLPGIAASLNRTLTMHGLPGHSHAAVRSFVGNGLPALIQRAAPSGADPELLTSLISLFKKDYDLTWAQGTCVYPGIPNVLDELSRAGHPLAMLSNKTHEFTLAIAREVFPSIYFSKVLGHHDGLQPKPHPGGALLIATCLGYAPGDCVIIGDSTIDLLTAENADMKSIAVGWGYHDRANLLAAGAGQVIETPSEIPALIG